MQRVQSLRTSYDPLVWWIIAGTMLTSFTSYMVMPFMALYMKLHTQATTGTIGLAIGASALTSVLLGLWGGSLSDKVGRKPLMVASVALSVFVMVGYANARSVAVFFLLSMGTGVARILFEPAAQALIAEVTPAERRTTAYGMRYWAENIGAAVGPIVGGYFGTIATGWTFYVSAVVNVVYLLVIIQVFPYTRTKAPVEAADAPFSIRRTLQTVAWDRALWLFLMATFLSNIGYSQLDTTLPQKMAMAMPPASAAVVLGIVLSSNAVEVVLLQFLVSRWVKPLGTITSMMVGQALFAIGYVGMGFASGLWTYLVGMLVITLGEIVLFPPKSEYLNMLAPSTMRASYFGASWIARLGFFLGPWIGGLVLANIGGKTLFAVVGLIVAAGIPFYRWSNASRMDYQSSGLNDVCCQCQ